MANQKTKFIAKEFADKIFDSIVYWEKPFSLNKVLPELRFILLTIAFFLINIALLTISEMLLEDSIIATMIITLIALLLTRLFSNLCLIGTSIFILIFIIKFSFMSYSIQEFLNDYQNFVRSSNPLNYFLQFDSTSGENEKLILTDFNESDRAKKCSAEPSIEFLNNFPDECLGIKNLMSDDIFTILSKNQLIQLQRFNR